MQGFIVFDFATRFAEARKELATWLSEGKIKRKETIIQGGLAAAGNGLLQLFQGVNTGMFHRLGVEMEIPPCFSHANVIPLGKLLVEIKPDSEKSRL